MSNHKGSEFLFCFPSFMNVISTFLKSLYKCTHTIISQNSEADMKRWKGKDFKGAGGAAKQSCCKLMISKFIKSLMQYIVCCIELHVAVFKLSVLTSLIEDSRCKFLKKENFHNIGGRRGIAFYTCLKGVLCMRKSSN